MEAAAAAAEPVRVRMDMMPPRVEDLRRFIKETRHVHFANTLPGTVPDTFTEVDQATRATEGVHRRRTETRSRGLL